ncbi:MAG: ATP-binding protein, partial [Candidatus Poribacteria bacterium]
EDQLRIVTDSIPIIEGYIQVLFDIPEIAIFIQKSRLLYFVSLIVVSVLLIFVIDMITNRLIMRPLESMMEIIKRAETNDLDSLPKSYSSGEIGRVTLSLVSMLRQLNESHSKRISALGQLAAGAAHDIRNPLNSIGMTAQHLKGIFSSPEEVSSEDIEEAKELLDIVNDEIKELKKITEQFLTLNRPKKLNLQPTDLNALLDKILSEFTLTMESAKVHVIRNYDKNLPAFQLDMGLIRQAIFNFVQNSIQAMSKGGSIYITTKMKQIDAGRQVDIEIRDTGVGIPEAIQEQIFDAYFTTIEKDGGMGLGLSISHQIITAHQGQVKLQSKVGMGTAFKISLPVKTD